VLTNRAGNLPESADGHFQGFCAKPFAEMTIAFNGDVVLCCQDWMLEEKFGNTNENSLEEIWTNRLFAEKRELLRGGQRGGLCKKCDFVGV
jgi:radical SAM protein with 4Fe4S-binding SPASM domain